MSDYEGSFTEGGVTYDEYAEVNNDGSGEAALYGTDGSEYTEAWDASGHGEISGVDGEGHYVEESF